MTTEAYPVSSDDLLPKQAVTARGTHRAVLLKYPKEDVTHWQVPGFRSRSIAPTNRHIGLPSGYPYPPSFDEDSIMQPIDEDPVDIVRYEYPPYNRGLGNKRKREPSDAQCPEGPQDASGTVPAGLPSNLPYREMHRYPSTLPNQQSTIRPADISPTKTVSNEESSTEDESDRESEANIPFVPKFVTCRGNEYFCDIDEDYLTDRFNLTGLNADVENYQHAIDLINDVFDADCDDDTRERIEKSARHLYGLIHARYITTTRGLQKMVRIGVLFLLMSTAYHITTIYDDNSYNSSQCLPYQLLLIPFPPSSKNTRNSTSAAAPASTAPPTPSSPRP